MWKYETSVEWTKGKQGIARCEDKAEITVATPPEFGGPEGIWTPEDLLTSAVESCIMASAIFFLSRNNIEWTSYRSNAVGTMEKSISSLVFTRIMVGIILKLKDPSQADAARNALSQAEKTCPLSNSLSCPVELALHVS